MNDIEKQTVLVIDDCPDFRALITIALGIRNFFVQAFSSAQDAIDYLKETRSHPEFIFVDLNMPGLTVEKFVEKLRADIRLQDIKIVLMSGCDNIARTAEKIDFDTFLQKPLDLNDLNSLIDNQLRPPGESRLTRYRSAAGLEKNESI